MSQSRQCFRKRSFTQITLLSGMLLWVCNRIYLRKAFAPTLSRHETKSWEFNIFQGERAREIINIIWSFTVYFSNSEVNQAIYKSQICPSIKSEILIFFQDPVSRYSYFALSKYNLLSKAEFDVVFDQGLFPYTVSQPPSLLSSPLFPFSGLVCYRVFVISNDYPLFLLHATPRTPLLVTALLYHPVPSLGYLSYSPPCPWPERDNDFDPESKTCKCVLQSLSGFLYFFLNPHLCSPNSPKTPLHCFFFLFSCFESIFLQTQRLPVFSLCSPWHCVRTQIRLHTTWEEVIKGAWRVKKNRNA